MIPSLVRAVRHILHFPVLLLQLALHLKIDLSFALDALLLHVADHTLMHRLSSIVSVVPTERFRSWGLQLGQASAVDEPGRRCR